MKKERKNKRDMKTIQVTDEKVFKLRLREACDNLPDPDEYIGDTFSFGFIYKGTVEYMEEQWKFIKHHEPIIKGLVCTFWKLDSIKLINIEYNPIRIKPEKPLYQVIDIN